LKVYNRVRFVSVASVDKEIIISPNEITGWIEDVQFRRYGVPGFVLGKSFWTKVKTKEQVLNESYKFKGIKEHFCHGIAWIDTCLFQKRYKKQMEDKKRSLEELAEEYEKYDVLFEDLKTNGFKSPNLFPLLDPIYIYIDANGNFIYTSNGNHRLYMAIIIGLKEMPVRVWARHTDWQRKRELLFLQGAEKFFALYPNLKGHPDLDDCKRKYE
jgi:hypothetical protein